MMLLPHFLFMPHELSAGQLRSAFLLHSSVFSVTFPHGHPDPLASNRGEAESLEVMLNLNNFPLSNLRHSIFNLALSKPGGSVRGEQANLTRLVLSCIEAKFCKKNMRWKALAEIYTMHSFAPFSMFNVLF